MVEGLCAHRGKRFRNVPRVPVPYLEEAVLT
jgi:hypothetical protein